MQGIELERVAANIREATTLDLLDRVTVYRAGMEPVALQLIEEELRRRGVSAAIQADHEQARREKGLILDRAGVPVTCEWCESPASWRGWGWHRLWGHLPLFPRRLARCEEHRPQ